MGEPNRSAIVISASSDIGNALSQRWLQNGWAVSGTYRTPSSATRDLGSNGVDLVQCDLTSIDSMRSASSQLRSLCPQWDVLVMCPGAQEPIGAFHQIDIDQWEESVMVNFTSQMRLIHELLPARRVGGSQLPCVLLFAGHGSNSALADMSAYIVSKIALIKMCELMDAEIPDARFVIIGPGPVLTKIHEPTYQAGERGGPNYQRTMDRLAKDQWVSMDEVLDCCDWVINSPREVVSGRNFSLVFDQWGTPELNAKLIEESNMYKLRRFGNDWLAKPPRW